MANERKFLRGSTAQNMAYTGASGVATLDMGYHAWRVHDGQTPGGVLQARAADTYPENVRYAALEALSGIRSVATRLLETGISPKDRDGVGDGNADALAAIRAAAVTCVITGAPLDLRGGTWKVVLGATDFLNLSGVQTVLSDFTSRIMVHRTAHADGVYAVTFGTPGPEAGAGRVVGVNIIGQLNVVSGTGRTWRGDGVYMKGSWFNVEHVHGDNFNGTGVWLDSVWDSTFTRVRAERCGNPTTWALAVSSTNDTANCLHIVSLQCESPYHKGIYANAIRTSISNIHTERLILMNTSGDANHAINMGNSTLMQATFDAAPPGTVADDGVTVAVAGRFSVTGYFPNSHVSGVATGGDFVITGGVGGVISGLICDNFAVMASAFYTTVVGLQCTNASLYDSTTLVNPHISNTLDFLYFAAANEIIGGRVVTVAATATIRGNNRIRGTEIVNLNDTRAPQAGHRELVLEDCDVLNCNGAYGAFATIRGGRCENVSLASQCSFDFYDVKGASFNFNGDPCFTTDAYCHWDTVVAWNLPLNRVMPSGSRTTRKPYTAGQGLDYINTTGVNVWAALTTAPA